MESTIPLLTELQREIFSYKPPCELKLFLSENPELIYLFSSEDSLMKLSEDYGLPYYKGITLDDLCMYSKMTKSALLYKASLLGDERVVRFLTQPHKIVKFGFNKNNYKLAMMYAAEKGHIELIKLMLKLEVDDYNQKIIDSTDSAQEQEINNYNITHAHEGGSSEIIEIFLEQKTDNYNPIMTGAARGGYIKIVKMMLKLGADNYNQIMITASLKGHIDIVELMLKLGANVYNQAMANAAYGGHIKIVKIMLDLGADNYNQAIEDTIEEGHIEVADLIKSYM